LTLPHWDVDSTLDLDYHVRRHALSGRADLRELFREIAPAYETPFDRSRPLWEARVYDGIGKAKQSALFFKLHHAVADGIGANAIFAALTDASRRPAGAAAYPPFPAAKGTWPKGAAVGARIVEALRDRVELDIDRGRALAGAVFETVRHPEKVVGLLQSLRSLAETVRFDSHSPVKNEVGRSRRLSGLDLPFAPLRRMKLSLGGSMIDVLLTIMARAMGKWHQAHRLGRVRELMTLVPVNLRKPEQWTEKAQTGNVASGILVPLPIRIDDPLRCHREIRKRMEEKKADPLSTASPVLAELVTILGHNFLTWMAEASFGSVDFIVTNVPGILVPRYLAGTEILSAHPFAPVAPRSPVSIALYGYRDRLFVGIDSDEISMPDVDVFQAMIKGSFDELCRAVRSRQNKNGRTRPAAGKGLKGKQETRILSPRVQGRA
jgi:WS/DGAT/MGAT family acyltransferase